MLVQTKYFNVAICTTTNAVLIFYSAVSSLLSLTFPYFEL